MIYRLLGDLSIEGVERGLGLREKYARVLASLLVSANHVVGQSDLLQAGWRNPDTDVRQLHKAANAIRKVLRSVDRDADLQTRSGNGYELQIADDDLDMLKFIRLTSEAERAAVDGPGDEAALLREALNLWTGSRPLANFEDGFLREEVAKLHSRRRRAAARLYSLSLEPDEAEDAFAELERLSATYPEDTRLCELLMIAAYRTDQKNVAIAAYTQHRSALERIGTSGGPDTNKLAYAISQDASAAIEEYAARLAVRSRRTRWPVPRELPPAPPMLVGRGDLVAEARWLLTLPGATGRVVVICGSAGVGKSALAFSVGHQVRDHFTGGELYAQLQEHERPVPTEGVLGSFLHSLGTTNIPESRSERVKAYRTLVADRRMLIVLDDAYNEEQIQDLLPGNSECGVLITARRRLPGLEGTHQPAPLEPLDLPDAMALFAARLRSAGITRRDDLAATERVVALCGGLPLTIGIAAAIRVRDLGRSMEEIAVRLSRHGADGLVYGNQSFTRTMGVSFDGLRADTQRMFLAVGHSRLAGFGRWTAAALGLDDPGGALSELVDGFLAIAAEHDQRYRFHDLTRDYAARRAAERAESDEYLTAIYVALLTLLRRAHRNLYGGDYEVVHCNTPGWDAPAEVLAEVDKDPRGWFEAERRNIRAAVGHCAEIGRSDLCWDLAVSSHEFYTLGGYFDDWYTTHTIALAACRTAQDRRGEGVMLTMLGQPALVSSRPEGAVSGLEQLRHAMELLSAEGDRHAYAIAARTLANALRRRGHLAEPIRLFQDALRCYEESGDPVGSCMTQRYIGQAYLAMNEHELALDLLRRSLATAMVINKPRIVALNHYSIGQAHLAVGDLDAAQASFATVAALLGEDEGLGHAYAFHGNGDVARSRGDYAAAGEWLDRALRLSEVSTDKALEGRVRLSRATLAGLMGDHDRQEAELQAAVECFTGGSASYYEAAALSALARSAHARGDQLAADAYWDRVRRLYAEMDLPEEDRIHRRPGA